MKILIINYYFEPFVGAHAYRWSQIAKVWAAAGYEVNVIAGRVGDVRREVRDGVAVERIGFVRRHVATPSSNTISPGKVSTLRSATITLLKKVNRFFFWPDGLWHWLPFLLVSLFKRRRDRYDLIVSYSPTFSAHVGGLMYKKLAKSNGRWIADYGDPFSISSSMPPNNFILYERLNKFFEGKVLAFADQVVFTNQKTKDSYEKCFSVFGLKVLPHAVDFGLFYSASSDRARRPNIVRLAYVGNFHRGIREPFEAISIIDKLISYAALAGIEVYFDIFGSSNGLNLSGACSGNIKYHGSIDRSDAIAKMRQADILVHIENSDCLMSPSKVVEYIASGRPVLNFTKDDVTALFNDYCKLCDGFYLKVNVRQSPDIPEILSFALEGCTKIADENVLRKFVAPFEISEISKAYVGLVDL